MKRSLLALFAIAAVISSCTPDPYKDNPVCKAIVQAAMAQYGNIEYDFSFTSLEVLDSTLLGTEFDRRIETFESRIKANSSLYEKYVKERKKKNAQIKADLVQHDKKVLADLIALKGENTARLGETAYYDYKFTALIKAGDKKLEMTDCYAAVTPDCEVLTLATDKKDLHKATGKVIPGYYETIRTSEPEEQ
ncbi:MAG: hypothetical protein KBT00_04040 [Bacteroidales bacterium]|nr:hypothetical protein [Candidatus Cacconaster merdequi]